MGRRVKPREAGGKTSAIEIGRRVGSEEENVRLVAAIGRVPSLGVSRARGQRKGLVAVTVGLLASRQTMLQ